MLNMAVSACMRHSHFYPSRDPLLESSEQRLCAPKAAYMVKECMTGFLRLSNEAGSQEGLTFSLTAASLSWFLARSPFCSFSMSKTTLLQVPLAWLYNR